MTEHFKLAPGTGLMQIIYGGRTVYDAAGNMVVGLPAANDYIATGVACNFSDFAKNWLFNWRWDAVCTSTVGPSFNFTEVGTAYIGAQPGTATTTTTLAAAPAGANFVFGHVRINRSNTPSKWLGQDILVKPPTNVWIPIGGSNSVTVEEQLGMTRAFSLYITGGNLVLEQQQTVSVGPYWAVNAAGSGSNVRTMMYANGQTLPSFGIVGASYYGGEWAVQSESNGAYTQCFNLGGVGGTYSGTAINGSLRRTTANGFVGANAKSVTDITDYHSNYSLDLSLRFCRAA